MQPLRWPLLLACAVAASAQQPARISSFDLGALDKSVEPCENFYQYACGTWRKNNPVPSDQSRWSRFNELAERNRDILHETLEKYAVKSNQKSEVDRQIGDYYAACMDEKGIESRGIEPLKPSLDHINKLTDKKQLPEVVTALHREGVRVLFSFFARPDAKNAQIQIASADQGGLGLPDRDFYLRTDAKSVETRKKYEDHIRAMFMLMDYAPAQAESAARQIVALETSLAKASLDRVARRNPDNTYHMMKVSDLEALTPSFAWNRYLSGVGAPAIQNLNVAVPDFFKGLENVLQQAELADIKSYLTWHVVRDAAPLLPKAFVEENFKFFGKTLTGAQELRVRWKRCVQATDAALGEALGQKFVERAFSPASKDRMLQLVDEIEKAMERDIKSLDWMSPATKDQAYTKLRLVTNKIGYPEKWRDYSSVKIDRQDPLGNSFRATSFEVQRNLQKIGKPVDKQEWSMTPPTVNAYYSPPMNNINFPAGILQPPFYDEKVDDAVNLGAIGAVIGHELTHGFDDQGRRYDGNGNLRDWWSSADAKEFVQRADCIVDEYGNFVAINDVKLNGRLTLGENAADNGGLRLAYMALMETLAKKTLPKVEGYSPEQRFFIGWAQIWCQNSTDENSRLLAQTDPHSPGQYRVNGVLQNMPEFRKAFSCKQEQPMVSSKGCRVW